MAEYLLDDIQDKLELQNLAMSKRWQRLKGEVKKIHRLKGALREEWSELREQVRKGRTCNVCAVCVR